MDGWHAPKELPGIATPGSAVGAVTSILVISACEQQNRTPTSQSRGVRAAEEEKPSAAASALWSYCWNQKSWQHSARWEFHSVQQCWWQSSGRSLRCLRSSGQPSEYCRQHPGSDRKWPHRGWWLQAGRTLRSGPLWLHCPQRSLLRSGQSNSAELTQFHLHLHRWCLEAENWATSLT